MSHVTWGKGVAAAALALVLPQLGMGCADDEPIAPTPHDPEEAIVPPPISGGDLALSEDGARAYIADAEIDVVHIVDLASREVTAQIALEPGDEPGRIVEGDGAIFVALRRGGAVAQIDPDSHELTRHAVCGAPRGLDHAGGQLHVACAGGELVTLQDGAVTRSLRLERDLRDVVALDSGLAVSYFRSAKIALLDDAGAVRHEITPSDYEARFGRVFTPSVAYRMTALPNGHLAVVHQRSLADALPTGPAGSSGLGQTYYGGTCDQVVVHAALSVFDPATGQRINGPNAGAVGPLVLPTDAAISPDGLRIAVPGPGNDTVFEGAITKTIQTDFLETTCTDETDRRIHRVVGEPVATVYSGDGLLVHTRQPAALMMIDPQSGDTLWDVALGQISRRHAGHTLFHRAASDQSPIACASCHPEGREDGHTWVFEDIGERRTQTLSGGVLETAPLHWDGDMPGMIDLVNEVFVNRMGGAEQHVEKIDVLGDWLQALPGMRAPAPADPDAVARGQALFNDGQVACASCHGGVHYTSNASFDVGTGKAFQAPSLIGVADRLPLMHDGCATTLRDRFVDPECGGGDQHGKTSHLSDTQIDDLIAFLETL